MCSPRAAALDTPTGPGAATNAAPSESLGTQPGQHLVADPLAGLPAALPVRSSAAATPVVPATAAVPVVRAPPRVHKGRPLVGGGPVRTTPVSSPAPRLSMPTTVARGGPRASVACPTAVAVFLCISAAGPRVLLAPPACTSRTATVVEGQDPGHWRPRRCGTALSISRAASRPRSAAIGLRAPRSVFPPSAPASTPARRGRRPRARRRIGRAVAPLRRPGCPSQRFVPRLASGPSGGTPRP